MNRDDMTFPDVVNKIKNIINSCKTVAQLEMSCNYIYRLISVYCENDPYDAIDLRVIALVTINKYLNNKEKTSEELSLVNQWCNQFKHFS